MPDNNLQESKKKLNNLKQHTKELANLKFGSTNNGVIDIVKKIYEELFDYTELMNSIRGGEEWKKLKKGRGVKFAYEIAREKINDKGPEQINFSNDGYQTLLKNLYKLGKNTPVSSSLYSCSFKGAAKFYVCACGGDHPVRSFDDLKKKEVKEELRKILS